MNLMEQLKRDEGFVPHVYSDSEGWLTIGYGTLVDGRKGGSIPESIAAELLQLKANEAMKSLAFHLPWTSSLDPARLGALQNMTYNMGIDGLMNFRKMLIALGKQDWDTAAAEATDSHWFRQTGDRSRRLVEQLRTGVWQ